MCITSYSKSAYTVQGDILTDTSYNISRNTTWHQERSKIHGRFNREAHENVGYFTCWKPRKLHIEKISNSILVAVGSALWCRVNKEEGCKNVRISNLQGVIYVRTNVWTAGQDRTSTGVMTDKYVQRRTLYRPTQFGVLEITRGFGQSI